jgi:hypothetical protein
MTHRWTYYRVRAVRTEAPTYSAMTTLYRRRWERQRGPFAPMVRRKRLRRRLAAWERWKARERARDQGIRLSDLPRDGEWYRIDMSR